MSAVTAVVTRMLAHVLEDSAQRPEAMRPFLLREGWLREQGAGLDTVLYTAERNVLPPRTTATPEGSVEWRIDRVAYPGVPLPSGELDRSVGHWNPAHQWEVFEVDHGQVVIVVARPGTPNRVDLVRAPAGAIVSVPRGGWHLTYAPDGPAVVTNMYSTPVGRLPHDDRSKYFRQPALRVGLRRCDGGGTAVFDNEAGGWSGTGEIREATAIAWPRLTTITDVLYSDDPTELVAAAVSAWTTRRARVG